VKPALWLVIVGVVITSGGKAVQADSVTTTTVPAVTTTSTPTRAATTTTVPAVTTTSTTTLASTTTTVPAVTTTSTTVAPTTTRATVVIPVRQTKPESRGPNLSSFSFSPTQIDTTHSSPVLTLTIQVADESGVRGGFFPGIKGDNGCTPNGRAGWWELIAGDRKNGTWTTTITVNQNAYCAGNIRVTSGFWNDEWNNVTWAITASQALTIRFDLAQPGDGCGNSCSQNPSDSTKGEAVGSGQAGSTRTPTITVRGQVATVPSRPNTTRQAPTTTSSTTTSVAPTTTTVAMANPSATTIPICTSTPNATGGSDIRCSDGSSATATQNVFGGQNVFKTGTGNKILTTKPNALGGLDITSNGNKTTTRPNVFGGQDFYQNGKKVATTRPNGTGGTDVYQGNKKVQTCSVNARGKQTCR